MERVPRCGYIRWRLSGDWVSSGANLCGFAEGLGTSGPQPEATLFSYQGQLVAAVELDELCCGCVVPLKVAFIHLKPKACGKGQSGTDVLLKPGVLYSARAAPRGAAYADAQCRT